MYNIDVYEKQYGALFVKQLEIEEGYKKLAKEAARKVYEGVEDSTQQEVTASQTKPGQSFIKAQWKFVHDAMDAFVTESITPKKGVRPGYVSLIKEIVQVCEKEETVNLFTLVTFTTLLDGVLKKDFSHSSFARIIGEELYNEVSLKAFLDNSEYAHIVEKGIQQRVGASYKRAYIRACMARGEFSYPEWDSATRLALGGSLIEITLRASNYFEYKTREEGNDKKFLEVVPTQFFMEQWQHKTEWLIDNSFKFCPTIIPPRDWENFNEGGYYGELAHQAKLLRLRNNKDVFAKEYKNKMREADLSNVCKAVNAIQSTPWKINKKVLEVAEYVIEKGGNMAGVPSTEELPKPAVLPAKPTAAEKKSYNKLMVGYYRRQKQHNSILLRIYAHIRTAKKFADYERIYFPCNMDFRGRVYPIPMFSFQGDDLNKSLIEFADAPACDSEVCWDWLLIEGANLAGVDKVSYDDRKAWVMEHEAEILAVAADPKGELWWADQDCPFQFLGWCFEYASAKAWKQEHSGSIKGFITGMNVALDGTCSGLQHFSAILRDPVGGKAVNLVPGEKPSDIYGIVAEKVNKVLENDILNGTADEQKEGKEGKTFTKYGTKYLSSVWLAYGVTRKVTKRSVMTLAYGSKEFGFKDQILEDTIQQDVDKYGDKSVFATCKFQASLYMAKLINEAVNTTVIAAVEGMKWLQECARLVVHSNQVVSWTTPMGLPVQQAYMEIKSEKLYLRCAGKQMYLYDFNNTGNIDKPHQGRGVAPNFIHSCDAAHLQLTVCNCYDKDIKHFAMIHDSYGTTLAQTQTMYDTVRESFIQMYTEHDVFQEFKDSMEALTDKEIPDIPNKGSLDIEIVRDSKYIFC